MSRDEDLNRQIGETLDRQVVDDAARAALRQARLAALENAPRGRRSRWIPAAAVTTLLVVGIATALLYPILDRQQLPDTAFDDLVVIDSEDELELLEELEFYVWLEQEGKG